MLLGCSYAEAILDDDKDFNSQEMYLNAIELDAEPVLETFQSKLGQLRRN